MMNDPTRRFCLSLAIVACASAFATAVNAQKKPPAPSVRFINLDKSPQHGEWQAQCPKFQLPADKSSIKIVAEDGGVVGSGQTGQRSTISKCKDGSAVWRQTINSTPTSLASYYAGTFYAGMSRKRGLAVDVGKFDHTGRPVWSAQVDGPGDEANAIIVKGGYGIYVFGASSGTLPGQPANAKGHRFLASYESGSGRRVWLKQSKDFGKGSVKPGSEFGPTPATIATDGVGNVYVLSSFDPSARVANGKGPVRLATLLKFDNKGKPLWRRTISVDPSSIKTDSFRATLRTMIVDGDGSSIYVAGDAVRNEKSELVIMRLDHQGKPRWTKLVSLAYSESGRTDEGWDSISTGNTGRVRGIGVRGGHLLIASEYFYDDVETLPEEPEMEVRETMRFACVADFHSTDGALRWARYYWGVDPQHGSPTEFEPTGLQILRSGAVAINGRDDFYVPATGQEFTNVASAFLLTDAKMTVNSEYPPNAVELEFFQAVQRAVKVGDKQWIADNIEYPMIVGPEVVIENESQFLKRYDSLLNDAARQAIAQQVGNQLWRQEPSSRTDGALVGARDMLSMSEGRSIAITSIGDGAAEDPSARPPPTAEVEPKAASEDKPSAAAEKSSKQLRREKMKKFFEDANKKAQTK